MQQNHLTLAPFPGSWHSRKNVTPSKLFKRTFFKSGSPSCQLFQIWIFAGSCSKLDGHDRDTCLQGWQISLSEAWRLRTCIQWDRKLFFCDSPIHTLWSELENNFVPKSFWWHASVEISDTVLVSMVTRAQWLDTSRVIKYQIHFRPARFGWPLIDLWAICLQMLVPVIWQSRPHCITFHWINNSNDETMWKLKPGQQMTSDKCKRHDCV